MTFAVQPKARRTRSTNQAIVDLDDVFSEPGHKFADWLQIAKAKLKQREIALLQQRQQICNNIIISMIHNFTSINSQIFDATHARCLEATAINIYKQEIQSRIIGAHSTVLFQYNQSINSLLAKWKGVDSSCSFHTFREYFLCCRTWFDKYKIHLLAVDFWIPICHLIEHLVTKSIGCVSNVPSFSFYKSYTQYFSTFINRGLFEAQMQPANTRMVWLVPAASYSTLLEQSFPIFITQHCAVLHGYKDNDIRIYYLGLMQDEMRVLREKIEKKLSADSGSTQ